MQIYISDAQYVYRALNGNKISKENGTPFFANAIKNGRFIGISPAKDGRQFNEYYKEVLYEDTERKKEDEEKEAKDNGKEKDEAEEYED